MKFYSRGKLLISGEYFVLKGAKALTVPLKRGQNLIVDHLNEPGMIRWFSKEYSKEWFRCSINFLLFEVLASSDDTTASFLVKLLKSAHELNNAFPDGKKGFNITTDLEFNLNWGFGSSSTLISGVAYWADVDPFQLHRKVSEGSGYDVVCARSDQPFFFSLKAQGYEAEPVDFNPEFRNQIYFIYLGRKQDSSISIRDLRKKEFADQGLLKEISGLSESMAMTHDLETFNGNIREHDKIISKLLEKPRLKESRFQDLHGEIKPLGAWGGDFAMLTWSEPKSELVGYLKKKHISVVFSFDEIVKTK
jgi:mevalonate kinase